MTDEEFTRKLFVDHRELRSGIVQAFEQFQNIDYEICELAVGDFVCSDYCAGERKRTDDFLHTFLDRKDLFGQLWDLKQSYAKPFLLLEGNPDDLYVQRIVHPNVIRSTLVAITIGMKIPIIYAADPFDAARLLYTIATREQRKKTHRYFNPHGKRSHMSMPQLQEYVVTAVYGVGPAAAQALLQAFGTVEKIFTAPVIDLISVDNIGPGTAGAIRKLMEADYN